MSKTATLPTTFLNPPKYQRPQRPMRPVPPWHPAHLSHAPKSLGFGRPAQSRAGQS